eukprot:1668951-Karenia_brevis.AAC.1
MDTFLQVAVCIVCTVLWRPHPSPRSAFSAAILVSAHLAFDIGTGVLAKVRLAPPLYRPFLCTASMRLDSVQATRDHTGVTRPGGESAHDETD